MGQHFLIDRIVLRRIIRAAELKKTDTVLEIGPGTGTLTIELAKTAQKVIAVEKDPKICQILKETLKNLKNIEIIQGDILKNQISNIKNQKYKVVANIPYYITSPLIRKFLEAENPPKLMVLMVQKEVAQRICSAPPEMNILALSVQFYAKPEIIGYVSKKSFWPKPKVDSAILRIAPLINTDKKLINADLFFKIVKAGFLHPRKQIINNLAKGLKMEKNEIKNWLKKTHIKPEQRAESLSLNDWFALIKLSK